MSTNKMTRKEIRECAFIILFEKNFQKDETLENLYEIVQEIGLPFCDDVKEIVEGVIEHTEEINEIIAKYSKNRSFARIAVLDKVILQIAIFEILYIDRTPTNAAIKEAVSLAEIYTYEDDKAFINGILGSYSKEIEVPEENESNE